MAVHYYPLINKILAQLNLRDSLTQGQIIPPDDSFSKPFITVAREPGSGGAPIARLLAEKLNFTFVDEQIVEEIAKSTRKRAAIIKVIDETHRTAIQDMVHSLLNTEYVSDIKYVTELVKVILAYAHRGHCVILGRGANFITPFAKGLHVNITAPYSVRVQRAMDFEGHSQAQAKKVIAKYERERKDFVKQYLKRDVNKKNAYDLTINTTYFSTKQSRNIILEAFYAKFSSFNRYAALLKK